MAADVKEKSATRDSYMMVSLILINEMHTLITYTMTFWDNNLHVMLLRFSFFAGRSNQQSFI